MNHYAKPASLLLLAILLAGCSTLAEFVPPVHILEPLWGDHLDAGRSYQFRSLIRSAYPIELVEVRLWDVHSNYELTWRVDNPGRSSTLSLDMPLEIPANAPADDDYRLDVTAFPGKGAARNLYSASGYSVRLAVDNPR
jgi:hypothetical protein